MGKVILDITMSLDCFIAGPNDDVERLHEWIFRDALTRPVVRGGTTYGSNEVLEESFKTTGAVVMGRRTFDIGEGSWGDNPPFQVPCFVLSHDAREEAAKGATTFTFVTNGIESALTQAKAAAGDKHVGVMGANTAQQCIKAGLLDEIHIHLVPVLLGEGIRLFDHLGTEHIELESTRVIESPGVTHLRFRVVK